MQVTTTTFCPHIEGAGRGLCPHNAVVQVVATLMKDKQFFSRINTQILLRCNFCVSFPYKTNFLTLKESQASDNDTTLDIIHSLTHTADALCRCSDMKSGVAVITSAKTSGESICTHTRTAVTESFMYVNLQPLCCITNMLWTRVYKLILNGSCFLLCMWVCGNLVRMRRWW